MLASRDFSVSVPTVWNSLKLDLCSVDFLGSFKAQLQSTLFLQLTAVRNRVTHALLIRSLSATWALYRLLPEPDYVTFRSLLSQIRLSVTLVHPTHRVEAFGNISLILCTLAILWPPCKILRKSTKDTFRRGCVKRNRGTNIKRFWTCRSLYLVKGAKYGFRYN